MFTYNIPNPADKEVVADWVELFITFQKDSISKSELASYINAASGSEPEELFIDNVWNTLRERAILYGVNPPFIVTPRLVCTRINWEESPEYLACLIYSLEGNPNTPTASAAEAGKYFERISNEAVKNYIQGQSMIYGFPSSQDVQNIAEEFLGEKFIHSPPSYRKDRNLDIIARKQWDDLRPSQIVLLIQCAAGNNWKEKLGELSLDAWTKYIHFAATPIKGFSVPVIISDKEALEEHSYSAGIIIDRTRLYKNTIGFAMEDADLRTTLSSWCQGRIAELLN